MNKERFSSRLSGRYGRNKAQFNCANEHASTMEDTEQGSYESGVFFTTSKAVIRLLLLH